MFSGPDFLYANAFFPNATTYVLAGLEPVGTVPDLTTLRRAVAPNLYQLHASLSSILSYSFFITKHMKSDLRTGRVNGTLPILYVFLARSGKTIREVTRVTLDDQGGVKSEADTSRGTAAHGVKIVFAGDDGEAKTLYYFSTNLANDGVKSSRFLKFCEPLAPANSLIKSASYLLHSGGFSTVRDFLLANSAVLVQDNSGIPLGYYDTKRWDLQPFGRYLRPISIFPGKYQYSYTALFRKSRPIDFGIGYRWRPENQISSWPSRRQPNPGPRHRLGRRQKKKELKQNHPNRASIGIPLCAEGEHELISRIERGGPSIGSGPHLGVGRDKAFGFALVPRGARCTEVIAKKPSPLSNARNTGRSPKHWA